MSHPQPSSVATLRRVTFRYRSGRAVLENVDLEIGRRDFIGLVGPNGGGKTTLLRIVLGLLIPESGTVEVLGGPPIRTRSRIGYVPQHTTIDASVPADVLDVVLMGRLARSHRGVRFARHHKEAAEQALELTGLSTTRRRRFAELSGGQKQRVLIARALAADAELLLLDEPTTGVDLHREKELLNLLHRLNERLPIVLVSHDIALVASHLERAVWVNRTVASYPANQLSAEWVESIYHGGEEA